MMSMAEIIFEYNMIAQRAFDEITFDQIVTLLCQLFSMVAAILFYHFANTKSVSTQFRHYLAAALGIFVVTLCYGWASLHLLVLCVSSYITANYLPHRLSGKVTFILAVGHVLCLHLYNYTYHYMEFGEEVSNSLMILSIKVTMTAFSISDNHRPTNELTRNQLQARLQKCPSWSEYFCYCFCFLGILFGPSFSYSDYISFIEGEQYKAKWPVGKAMKKMASAIVSLILFLLFKDVLNAQLNLREDIMASGLIFRHLVLYATMCCMKWKYYFGWLSSESICYFGGLGYDPKISGEQEWGSRIPTVQIIGVERATSLKSFLDNWNMFTARWLHFCIYERAGSYGAILTFLLSATWHGFYPGYYLLFLPYAMGVLLGRKVRRNIRPMFQSSSLLKVIYACITWLGTAILICYHGSAFHLKEYEPIYKLQRSLYFWPHIVVIIGLLVLPTGKSSRTLNTANSNGNHKAQGENNGDTIRLLQAG